MKSKSILLRMLICCFVYVTFVLLLFFIIYKMHLFAGAFYVGLPSGFFIALVTHCDTLKRTVIARSMGLLSVAVSHFIMELLNVPYTILMYIFRYDTFVRQAGHLSINEMIGYGWGRYYFWSGLLISFMISIAGIFIVEKVKSRTK